MMHRVIDSHHHYWHSASTAEHDWSHPDHRDTLHQDFLTEDLDPCLQAAGVAATVLIQAANSFAENERMLRFAAIAPSVAGVVGYMPMSDYRLAREIFGTVEAKRWCGVRQLIGADPLDWLLERDVLRVCDLMAQRGLAWDVVVVSQEQAAAVAALGRAVPELRIIVDHLARPPVGGESRTEWKDRIAMLADRPNIAMKVSVGVSALTVWGAWNPAELEESVAEVLQEFTPRRLMQASNWPVSLLAAPYEDVWHDIGHLLGRYLNADELAQVQGGTATEWYGLAG